MAGYAPAAVVAGPVRLPLPYGLFSVAPLAEAATERWESGVSWEALSCEPAGVVVGDCDDPEGFPKEFAGSGGVGEASAFTVYGTYTCSPSGPVTHAQDQARAVLLAREEQAAETRLWQMFIDDPDSTPVAVDDVITTLGTLEQWLADAYGSLGVIHASRNAATTLTQKGLIRPSGAQMRTNLGTPVIAGGGYPGTSASGAAPAAGTEWIVASPALFGYRSQVFEQTNRPGDLLARSTNDLFGIAERNYLLGYDPCGVAFAALPLGCC